VAVVFPGFVKTAVSMNALTGSGEALGKMDDAQAKAMTADEFAVATVKALRKGKSYIVIGGFKEKLAAWVARLSPELLYRLIRKSKVR
jgi:short-subunit dehydrogenase